MLDSWSNAYRDKAPGQRECDEAIDVLNNCIREVDQASLAAISQQLSPRDDISHEVCVILAEYTVQTIHTVLGRTNMKKFKTLMTSYKAQALFGNFSYVIGVITVD